MKKLISLNTICGIAAVVALGGMSVSPATAAPLADLTFANPSDIFGGPLGPTGAVDDTYTFDLKVGSDLTAVAVESTTMKALSSVTLDLYKGTSLITSGSYANGVFAYDLLVTNSDLTSGWYSLVVEGTGAGKGKYSGSISINPVPIPGALLLFGSGLIGLSVLGRRKSWGRTIQGDTALG